MIFGFLLTIIFDPFTWQGATQPRWAFLAVALVPLIIGAGKSPLTVAHLIGAFFFVWALLSFLWTPNIYDAAGSFEVLLIVAGSFVFGARLGSLEKVVVGMAIGLLVNIAVLVVSMFYKLPSIVLTYPHGLFGNRNMLSEIGALVALGCLIYRKWWCLPAPLVCVFWYDPSATGGIPSRGAVLALATGLLVLLWQRYRTAGYAVFSLLIIALLSLFDFQYRMASINERFMIWNAVFSHSNLLGHGLGSLYSQAPYFTQAFLDSTVRRLDHAHNEPLEIYYELGIIGLGLFAGIVGGALRNGDPKMAPLLAAFMAIALVAFPLHIPANAFFGALVLGHSVRRWPDMRGLLYSGGARLRSWLEVFQRAATDKRADRAGVYVVSPGGDLEPDGSGTARGARERPGIACDADAGPGFSRAGATGA